MPDRPDAAGMSRITSIGVHRVSGAVDLEGLMLRCGHDISYRDGGGLLGQEVAALGSSHALDQAGPPEPQQDLLDIISRKSLGVGELPGSNRSTAPTSALGQVDRDDQAVFGPGGDPHSLNMPVRTGGINVSRDREPGRYCLSAEVQRATSSALMLP